MADEKFTAEQMAEALRRASGIKSAAARLLNCEWRTVQRYIDKYPTVKQAHDEATEVILDVAEGHLVSAVKRGEWDQVKYYLNAKGRSRGYGERSQAVNLNVTPDDLKQMDDKQLDALIAQLSKS